MTIYLGLGTNLGDRRDNLTRAIDRLAALGVRPLRVSPVVETAALLPKASPDDWNRPYLNLVLECATELSPQNLLGLCKGVEAELGREPDGPRWSPRPIDIDILLYEDEIIDAAALRVPHPRMHERDFVLAPLVALNPELEIPGRGETVLMRARELGRHIPLWMGIVNVTPDSFSDGGRFLAWPAVEAHIDAMYGAGAHIIDLGAESTRPGARPLTAAEELARLEPILERLMSKYRDQLLKPRLSIDTYHVAVARRALELGVDIINDVSGLTDPAMIELAASSEAEWIAMHQLGLPADPTCTLSRDVPASTQVERWLDAQLEAWQRAGIGRKQLLFDPGIGFGKTPLQSLELLHDASRFQRHGIRSLIGHSRKSFIGRFDAAAPLDRDLATIGVSLYLIERGVDVLRVHNVPAHLAAYKAWAHVR